MKILNKLCIIILALSFNIYAQSFTVKGRITSSTGGVRYASVTFVDNNDISKKYSTFTDTSGNYQLNIITSINSNNNNLPIKFELEQNYPNPFSNLTVIPYKLKKQSDVKVTIYDILGRVVRNFSAGTQTVGVHSIEWDGKNNFGQTAATGIYFYRLQAGDESSVKKMVFEEGKSNFLSPVPGIISSNISENEKVVNMSLQGENYTVQIDNSTNTLPAIIPQQFSNIIVQSDTTLNFSVSNQNIVTVYLDSTRQIIRGFGAANIVQWRPDMTPAEIQTAFGNDTGQLGFTILRLRIPPDSTSFKLNVSTAKAAYSLGAKLIATPWTPPAWMKSNNSTVGGTLDTNAYTAYAEHLKAFADSMANNGAPLFAVSVQNEPDANVNYESCFWNATQFLNFMKYYAPQVGIPVFMPESESFVKQLSDSTLNDSIAASHVAFIGCHLYGVSPSTYPLATSKGKEVWMTEHLTNTDSASIWSYALPVGKEINDCMNANMSAYIWWYMVRFYGPIDENGNVTKRGYVMSQFSKFIRPGYFRITCNPVPQRNVYVTAYRDSASLKTILVVLNTSSSSIYQTFSVVNATMNSFMPFTTSALENCKQGSNISVVNGSFTAVLEPSSITTFVSN